MKNLFFTGSFCEKGKAGICGFKLNEDNSFSKISEFCGVDNPSYLCINEVGDTLYSVSELEKGGEVVALRINDDGSLTEISRVKTSGDGATHIAVCGDKLAVAQYYSGDVDLYKSGSEGKIISHLSNDRHSGRGKVPERQDSPHAHYVGFDPFDKNKLWAVDLGNDTIYVYDTSGYKLDNVKKISVPAGEGPRHLLFSIKHPDIVYYVCEITYNVFAISKSTGDILDSVSAIDPGFDGFGGSAAIRFDGNEDCIYISNRVLEPTSGMDSIAMVKLNPDTGLFDDNADIIKTGYRFPRDMNIFKSRNLLITAFQFDNILQVRRKDKFGRYTEILYETEVEKVCCITDLI